VREFVAEINDNTGVVSDVEVDPAALG